MSNKVLCFAAGVAFGVVLLSLLTPTRFEKAPGNTAAKSFPSMLILDDFEIVGDHLDEYNVYMSSRAKEYGRLQDMFLSYVNLCHRGQEHQVFFDVGANVGLFTDVIFAEYGYQRLLEMQRFWKQNDIKIEQSRIILPRDEMIPTVHVFEPEPNNFKALEGLAKRYPEGHMIVHHAAVADKAGTMPMYDGGNKASGNTQGGLVKNGNKIAHVQVVTLDEFIKEKKIQKVAVVKIDVEGFELEVFKGMEDSVGKGIIDLFLFEYGHKWTGQYGRDKGVTLKEVCRLLDSWGLDTFLMGQFNNVRVNGSGYDPRYEDTGKFVSMEMFSIARNHPKYTCIVSGLRTNPGTGQRRAFPETK